MSKMNIPYFSLFFSYYTIVKSPNRNAAQPILNEKVVRKMTKKQLSMNDTSFKTSLMEKIAYGMGDTACNVVFAITSSLIVYFYTNVIGMSAALVGTILLVSRVFDGISDLLIAQIVDKVKLPEGKARAWILWMAAPYGIAPC